MNLIQEHRRICRNNAKIVVENRYLWNIYKTQAEINFEKRKQRWGPDTGRTLFEPVDGYRQVYGEALAEVRPKVGAHITRNDIVLVKNGIIVARAVDFIAELNGIDGPTFLTCLGYYLNVYDHGAEHE